MRRIIMILVATLAATLLGTAVQSTANAAQASSARASSACNISSAPQGRTASYGGYVRLNGSLYRSSCAAWSAFRTGTGVHVFGAIRDTATDGCYANFAFRFWVNGNPSQWKVYYTTSESRWAKFDYRQVLTGVPTSIEVVAYRQCAGGTTGAYGSQLNYNFR